MTPDVWLFIVIVASITVCGLWEDYRMRKEERDD